MNGLTLRRSPSNVQNVRDALPDEIFFCGTSKSCMHLPLQHRDLEGAGAKASLALRPAEYARIRRPTLLQL